VRFSLVGAFFSRGGSRFRSPRFLLALNDGALWFIAVISTVCQDSNQYHLTGLDAQLAEKRAASYNPELEKEAQQWIEAVTGESLPGTFQESLKDGVILCKYDCNHASCVCAFCSSFCLRSCCAISPSPLASTDPIFLFDVKAHQQDRPWLCEED